MQALRRSTLPRVERDALDHPLSEKAGDHLFKAFASGYRNVKLMTTDPDLDPIRLRPDFKLPMTDLALPSGPFAGGK